MTELTTPTALLDGMSSYLERNGGKPELASKIYILDEVIPARGMTEAYKEAYFARYAPGARRRGATLERTWMSPAFLPLESGNALHFLWSYPNLPAWWRQRLDFSNHAEKEAFWNASDIRAMIASRRYAFLMDLTFEAGGVGV